MLNKEKRSLLLSMVLGDGCLHYIKNNKIIYGGFTMHHGLDQTDYCTWKAQIVGKIFDKEITLRNGNAGKSIQFSVCMKRLRAWRKFCYPNNKKSISKVLRFITNPTFALAIWLMDDGYVETGSVRGTKRRSGGRFRIYTCDQSLDEHDLIIKWFQDNLNITPKVGFQKKGDKTYPFLKINQADSLLIWSKIRETVLGLKSMQHKFRFIEQLYQVRFLQRVPSES